MGNGLPHEMLPRPSTPQLFPVHFLPTRPVRRPGYEIEQRESGQIAQTMPLINGRHVCVFTCKLHSVAEDNHLYLTYIWDYDAEPTNGALAGVEYCVGNLRDAEACHLTQVQFVRANYEDESAESPERTVRNPLDIADQEEIRDDNELELDIQSLAQQFSDYNSLLDDSNIDSPLSAALNQIVPISPSGSELTESDYRLMEGEIFEP